MTYRPIYSITNVAKMVSAYSWNYDIEKVSKREWLFFTVHEVVRLTFHDAIGFSKSGALQ